MAFELGPYIMKISYAQLGFGVHTLTHSIDEWIDTSSTNNAGRIRKHDGGDEDTLVAIEGFLTKIKPFFTADVSFNSATIYRQLLPTDTPTPVVSIQFTGIVGTSGAVGWHVATEKTINMRSTAFNTFKLVFLDCDSLDDWDKVSILPSTGALHDLFEYLVGTENFVIARDGNYPSIFLSQTITLNEKLRRASGLA
jgi:hypothetical protein